MSLLTTEARQRTFGQDGVGHSLLQGSVEGGFIPYAAHIGHQTGLAQGG